MMLFTKDAEIIALIRTIIQTAKDAEEDWVKLDFLGSREFGFGKGRLGGSGRGQRFGGSADFPRAGLGICFHLDLDGLDDRKHEWK